ncbi:MAG: type II secretion system F family protein [Elusimicrobiaceae bacterium]|nr:type II secretion system F family protein [Elusimicrobiaceae bacterium]
MPKFNCTVQDPNGSYIKSSITADNMEKAIFALQSKGLIILEIKPERAKNSFASVFSAARIGSKKIKGHVMAFFAEQLSTLLSGGVPLIRAISLLGEYSTDRKFGPVLVAVARDIAGGSSMHEALAKFPIVFDHTWVSMIEAGEVGGHLADALMQVAKHVKSKEALRSKIITAVTYPAVLFLMSICVLGYFVVGIVPTFDEIFRDFDIDLPPLTKAIVAISHAVADHWLLILVIIISIIVIFRMLISTPSGKKVWHKFHLTMPIFGNFISNIYFEKLLNSMSTLLNSGVSIINVLTVMEESFSGNVIIREAIVYSKNEVASGKSLSESFRKTKVFPGLMTEMMLMGEESGRLPSIMETLAQFYQEQVNQFLARFSALIDPILIVGIGSIIGVIVLSIFLPIFKMSQIGG